MKALQQLSCIAALLACSLPASALDDMRSRVFARDQAAPETPQIAARPLLELPFRELLLHGFLVNRGMVVIAAVMTLVTQHLFEGRAGFEPVFRAVAYGAAPSAAFWVPVLGAVAALYACFLHVRGIERVQGLDAVRAILATAIAWVATILVVGGFPVRWFGPR